MEAFLTSLHIPRYNQRLLELAGVVGVSDLIDIDEDFLQSIEQQVRIGAFQFQVDFTSKQNRMEYFGIDYAQLDQFSFRLMDRTKLLKVSEAAKKKLAADMVPRRYE